MYANIPTQGETHARIHTHTLPSLSAICSNVAAVIKGVTARQVEVMIMGRSYFCSPPSCSWALCLLPRSLSLAHIFLFFTAKHSPLVQVGPKCSSAHTPTHACLSPYTHPFLISPFTSSWSLSQHIALSLTFQNCTFFVPFVCFGVVSIAINRDCNYFQQQHSFSQFGKGAKMATEIHSVKKSTLVRESIKVMS